MADFNRKYDVRESAPTLAAFHRSNADFRASRGIYRVVNMVNGE